MGALAFPLALVEAWRWSWLGADGYSQWWKDELAGILYQAGVSKPATVPVASKIVTHFGMLTSEIGRSAPATGALFAMPLLFATFFIFSRRTPLAPKWWLLGLSAIATCYLVWWMAITPTEKAWLRRIYIGLIALALIGVASFAWAMQAMLDRGAAKGVRIASGAWALLVLALYAPFASRAINVRLTFEQGASVADTVEAARFVSRLGPEVLVFAHGWYAAPTVALHSGRSFVDFTDWPVGDFPGRPAYIVADRASFVTRALDPVLARYPHRPMLKPSIHAQVYQLDLSSPRDPFTQEQRQAALPFVEFAKTPDYPATFSLQPFDPVGGRWAGSDSEVLLAFDGQPWISLNAYMGPQEFFRKREPVGGKILVEGCRPQSFKFRGTGWEQFRMPLTSCQPTDAAARRVRLLLNNTMDLPLVYDHQRALLVGSIGFVDQ